MENRMLVESIFFAPVSKKQFVKDFKKIFYWFTSFKAEVESDFAYDHIKMPKRSTSLAAGYDFYSPISFRLKPGRTIRIPTGVRVHMAERTWLAILPRSSTGLKYNTTLDNTVGVIDADYYYADNEGHVMVQMTNHHKKSIFPWVNKKHTLSVTVGDRIVQGIFLPYMTTDFDNTTTERTGGIGSSGR